MISTRNVVDCGVNSFLPVNDFLFGTGIAFTIIGSVSGIAGFLIILTGIGAIPVIIILLCSGAFTFAWMIVGSVSLFRDGLDCQELNYEVWAMALATNIIMYVMFLFSVCATKSSSDE